MPKDRFNMSPYHMLPLTLKDQRTLLELENELVEDTFRNACVTMVSRMNAMDAARDQAAGYQAYNTF
ncbi:hypothetical protein PRIC2_014066 [Phytophthora ramorum]